MMNKKRTIATLASMIIGINAVPIISVNAKVIEPEVVKTETWTTSYYKDDNPYILYPYIDCQADIYDDGTVKVYFWNTYQWSVTNTDTHILTIVDTIPTNKDSETLNASNKLFAYNAEQDDITEYDEPINMSIYPKTYTMTIDINDNSGWVTNLTNIYESAIDDESVKVLKQVNKFIYIDKLSALPAKEETYITFTPIDLEENVTYNFTILGHDIEITPDMINPNIFVDETTTTTTTTTTTAEEPTTTTTAETYSKPNKDDETRIYRITNNYKTSSGYGLIINIKAFANGHIKIEAETNTVPTTTNYKNVDKIGTIIYDDSMIAEVNSEGYAGISRYYKNTTVSYNDNVNTTVSYNNNILTYNIAYSRYPSFGETIFTADLYVKEDYLNMNQKITVFGKEIEIPFGEPYVSPYETIETLTNEITVLKAENENLRNSLNNKSYGDINGDNIIDARDATLLLTYYAKTSTGYEGTLEEFVVNVG